MTEPCGLCGGAGVVPYCRLCLTPDPRAIQAAPAAVTFRRTRWDATDTTFGPRLKVSLTVAMLWVALGFAWVPGALAPLRWVTVPSAGLLCWLMLRSLWRPGFARSGDVPHHAGPAGHGQGERHLGATVATEDA